MTRRNKTILLGSVLAVILAVIGYALLDRPLALYCRTLNRDIVHIFQWITELGKSTGYLIGLAVLFVYFRYVRRRPDKAGRMLFLFSAIALAGLITDVIKPLAGRLRPKLLIEAGLYGFDPFRIGYEYNSFPSGHATTIFALATALSFLFPQWRWPLFGFAAIIGLSRIMVGAHFFSDVLGGVYIGIMTVLLLAPYFRRRGWIQDRPILEKEKNHA
jgi:membrane-associated phospholipid phosphatase